MTDREISEARFTLLKAIRHYMDVTGTKTFQLSDLGIVDTWTLDPMHTVDPMHTST
jgi:hypothetical protein